MSEERVAHAYREAGKAVAAHVLGGEPVSLDSKNPDARARAYEIEATIALAGPCAELRHAPATNLEQAEASQWAADLLYAHARTADAVLCTSRPDEPWPEPSGGAIMLEADEAMEALSTMARLKDDAKALVAARWFAINSVAGVLLERGSISGAEIGAIVRSHSAGKAN